MRLGVTGEVNEGYVAGGQVPHNLVAAANAADLPQLGDTVLVVVNPQVRLNVQHSLHHGVGRLHRHPKGTHGLTRQVLLVGVQVVTGDVLPHLVLFIAHLNQLRHGGHLAVGNDG